MNFCSAFEAASRVPYMATLSVAQNSAGQLASGGAGVTQRTLGCTNMHLTKNRSETKANQCILHYRSNTRLEQGARRVSFKVVSAKINYH